MLALVTTYLVKEVHSDSNGSYTLLSRHVLFSVLHGIVSFVVLRLAAQVRGLASLYSSNIHVYFLQPIAFIALIVQPGLPV